jgi:5,10-methenyltetrahydromethanopterin hydrogenase
MADLSGDDDVGVQNTCEDVNEVQVVDESEQAEFFKALLHRCFDPSMFLIKRTEALKKAATEHLYEKSKGCTNEFTTLRAVLQFFYAKISVWLV